MASIASVPSVKRLPDANVRTMQLLVSREQLVNHVRNLNQTD